MATRASASGLPTNISRKSHGSHEGYSYTPLIGPRMTQKHHGSCELLRSRASGLSTLNPQPLLLIALFYLRLT